MEGRGSFQQEVDCFLCIKWEAIALSAVLIRRDLNSVLHS